MVQLFSIGWPESDLSAFDENRSTGCLGERRGTGKRLEQSLANKMTLFFRANRSNFYTSLQILPRAVFLHHDHASFRAVSIKTANPSKRIRVFLFSRFLPLSLSLYPCLLILNDNCDSSKYLAVLHWKGRIFRHLDTFSFLSRFYDFLAIFLGGSGQDKIGFSCWILWINIRW